MKRRIGTDENYIEFNDTLTYGTKKNYEHKRKPNSFKINDGEVGFELSQSDFAKSPELVLITGCLTKLVENEKVLFDRAGNPREQIAYEVLCDVVENSENLDKMLEEIIEKNFKPKTLIKEAVDEEKND
nr:hypothetical protein [Fusobacterium gastrosuis]